MKPSKTHHNSHIHFNKPLYNMNEMTSIYYGRDMRDVIMKPLNALSRYSNQILFQPFSLDKLSTMGKLASANLEVAERLTNRYEKPRWGINNVSPRVVASRTFCNLVHFESNRA